MAADKILARSGANITEYAPAVTGGGGDANKVAALDGTGRFPLAMMPTDVADELEAIVCSEALSAGDFVNVFDAGGGVFKARKADANANKPAHGFVKAAYTTAQAADIYFEGINAAVTSVTPGALYLSAATPGGFTAVVPSAAGQLVQQVGIGVNASAIKFQPRATITLA